MPGLKKGGGWRGVDGLGGRGGEGWIGRSGGGWAEGSGEGVERSRGGVERMGGVVGMGGVEGEVEGDGWREAVEERRDGGEGWWGGGVRSGVIEEECREKGGNGKGAAEGSTITLY